MNPEIWGPHAWFFLHSIGMNYPTNPTQTDKNKYYNFFESLQNVLPCSLCRENYKKHFKEFPLKKELNSRLNLRKWIVTIHNEVNKLKNKKLYNFKEVQSFYKDIYDKKIDYKTNYYKYFFYILLIIILLFCLKNKKYILKNKKKILF